MATTAAVESQRSFAASDCPCWRPCPPHMCLRRRAVEVGLGPRHVPFAVTVTQLLATLL